MEKGTKKHTILRTIFLFRFFLDYEEKKDSFECRKKVWSLKSQSEGEKSPFLNISMEEEDFE